MFGLFAFADIAHQVQLVHRLGEHWDAVLPGRVLHMRYEDLVRDQVGCTDWAVSPSLPTPVCRCVCPCAAWRVLHHCIASLHAPHGLIRSCARPHFLHWLPQEAATRRLLAHCGIPWEGAVLRFHETQRTVATASLAQVGGWMGGAGRVPMQLPLGCCQAWAIQLFV